MLNESYRTIQEVNRNLDGEREEPVMEEALLFTLNAEALCLFSSSDKPSHLCLFLASHWISVGKGDPGAIKRNPRLNAALS